MARLAYLERQRVHLEGELRQAEAMRQASGKLDGAVEDLLRALGRFHEILDAGEPEQRKAVVPAFLQEMRIEKTTRQAVLRWSRLPRSTYP